MSQEIVQVPVHELHPGENVRSTLRAGDLAASVEELGVLQPLLVYRDSLGGLTILDGHRRFHAAKSAGKTTVPVIILEDAVLKDQRVLNQLVLNDAREALTDADRIEAAHQLALFGVDEQQLAKALGQKRERVAQYRRAGNSETARKMAREIQLTLDVALRIAQAEEAGADMELLEEKLQQLQTQAFKDGSDIPGWQLNTAIDRAVMEGLRLKKIEKLRAQGVQHFFNSMVDVPFEAERIEKLGLTAEEHQDCEFRAMLVTVNPNCGASATEYCLDSVAAGHEDEAMAEAQRAARFAEEHERREREERERAEAEAQETRIAFLKDLCRGVAPKGWEYLVARGILLQFTPPLFKEILISAGAPGTAEDFNPERVLEWAKQRLSRLQMVIFTNELLLLEGSFRMDGLLANKKTYLEHLEKWGYTPSPYECECIGRLPDMEDTGQEGAVAS